MIVKLMPTNHFCDDDFLLNDSIHSISCYQLFKAKFIRGKFKSQKTTFAFEQSSLVYDVVVLEEL